MSSWADVFFYFGPNQYENLNRVSIDTLFKFFYPHIHIHPYSGSSSTLIELAIEQLTSNQFWTQDSSITGTISFIFFVFIFLFFLIITEINIIRYTFPNFFEKDFFSMVLKIPKFLIHIFFLMAFMTLRSCYSLKDQ